MKKLLLFLLAVPLLAQPTTVSIVDTLYNPDGSLWTGTIDIQPSSISCRLVRDNVPYGLSSKRICLGGTGGSTCNSTVAAGVINIALVPTVGSTPAGCAYNARFEPTQGTAYPETWIVGATGPLLIKDVRQVVTTGLTMTRSYSQSFTSQTSVAITPSIHGFSSNILVAVYDASGNQMDAAVNVTGGTVTVTFSEAASGSVVISGGTGTGYYSASLTASPQTISAASHGIYTNRIIGQCFDASGNQFECGITVHPTTFAVTVEMTPAAASTIVLQGR